MIRFKSIRFKNFLSYGSNFTEIILDSSPNTLLIGESGTGKSSVTDAISFVLFNRPFRSINKNQLVNAINNGDCLVEIEFSIGKKEYKIRRGIKPNIFEIYYNDKLINQDSHNRDYQSYLEKNILNLNFKIFSHIVILGAVNFVPFMELKPNERRVLIENLLDIQIFSNMSLSLKQRIVDIKSAISKNNLSIETYKEKISLYEKYILDLKKNKEQKINENIKKIELNEENITSLESKNYELKLQLKNNQSSIMDEEKLLDKMDSLIDFKKSIENNIKKINKDLLLFEKNKICPTCSREFDDDYKKEATTEKSKKKDEYIFAINKINVCLKKIYSRIDEINIIKLEMQDLNKKISSNNNTIDAIKQYIIKIREEIDSLSQNTTFDVNEEFKIKTLNDDLIQLENNHKKLLQDKMITDIAMNLLQDGGIKTKIIKQYLPIINKLVNKFLNTMNFYVTFKIDENFQEIIKSRGRDDFVYSSLSDGERQRLNVAILLTWRAIAMMKNSVNTNLLFIDELLDSSLDPIATENIIELINNEPLLKKSNIFIISHKTSMVDKFSSFIKFEKHKNFSRTIIQ